MSVNHREPVTRAPICVLWLCACNHPAADHDGENGECLNLMDINDLGATLCECLGFSAPDEARP